MASASHLAKKVKNYKVPLPCHCPFPVDLSQGAAGLDVRQLWTPGQPEAWLWAGSLCPNLGPHGKTHSAIPWASLPLG